MRVSRVFTICPLFIICASGIAQTPNMKPPKQLDILTWCLGEWNGSMHWTMQGTPEMNVVTTLKFDMDGQFLREVASQDMQGTSITETTYTGWNDKDKKYDSWIFTNYAPNPRIQHGEVKGNDWVMESEPWDVMGQVTSGRFTITKVSDTEMKIKLEFKANGKSDQEVAEGTFKKKTLTESAK